MSSPSTPLTQAYPSKCATCDMLAHAPLVCPECHELLGHVQGADYFELLGLPRSYRIDESALSSRYRAVSRNIHPDRFAGADDEMQSIALRLSAAVNRAYEVLRDPLLRAEYLLESTGGASAAKDKSVPGDLLTRVMMTREEMEDARAGGDEAKVERIRREVADDKARVEGRIAMLCDQLSSGDEGVKKQLRAELNAVKYLNNLLMHA